MTVLQRKSLVLIKYPSISITFNNTAAGVTQHAVGAIATGAGLGAVMGIPEGPAGILIGTALGSFAGVGVATRLVRELHPSTKLSIKEVVQLINLIKKKKIQK